MNDQLLDEVVVRGQLDRSQARQYVLSGNAILTFRNSKTGNRFTFKISKPRDAREGCPHFVSVLNGPNNERDYRYFANIWEDVSRGLDGLQHGRKSRISPNAESVRVFTWLWDNIDDLPECIEVWHEGQCLMCGRRLTDPDSIARGIGPVCLKK